MPNIRWLLRLITVLHRFVYIASGGRLGASLNGKTMLLLTHVGRKSGQTRVTPLLYVADDLGFIVVASNAGDDRPPAWWFNLMERPEAEVRAGRERVVVRARQVEGDEEVKLWERLVVAYPPYSRYRERTSRHIPVVVLERVG